MQAKPNPEVDLSAPPRSRLDGYKSRHVARLSNIPLLGRSVLVSRIQQVANQAPPGSQFPSLIAFLQFWKWALPYLRDFIHRRAQYQTYGNGETGVFSVAPPHGQPLRIAVNADWGTGTLEAETVALNMKACDPSFTVHMGDVYYMGEGGEIDENCLGKPRNGYKGVYWPLGSHGSFALMGNHEMYSGGQGYFSEFLPRMGLRIGDRELVRPQRASFFCLDAAHWLVLGLDTGYHSGGIPMLGSIPVIRSVPFLNVDARFDDKMLSWLSRTIDVLQLKGNPKRPVLVLTHHQPFSSFEQAFQKPEKQLEKLGFLRGQEFVWLYGHEHRLTIYNKQELAGALAAYPRCIGHGGMPVEATVVKKPDKRIFLYDPRTHPIDNQDPSVQVGYNGHIELVFEGAKLTIEYHDILKNILLTESFIPNGAGGLEYSFFKPSDSPLVSGAPTT